MPTAGKDVEIKRIIVLYCCAFIMAIYISFTNYKTKINYIAT